MNFGEAIEAARAGKKIQRAGWNGKSMWVCHMPGRVIPAGKVGERIRDFVPTGDVTVLGYFVMWTADQKWLPGWLASQTDMLATDWSVVA